MNETERDIGGLPQVISLGAGVQSSAMALMAAKGEIGPMPTCAIFADTQGEPKRVYEWLNELETLLPFPVLRCSKGSLAKDSLRRRTSARSGKKYVQGFIPAFIKKKQGNRGLLWRKCTADYKVRIMLRTLKKHFSIPRGCKTLQIAQWIGISTDEAQRMKDSREPWTVHRWPLIEQGISRKACLEWMRDNGYPEPPRSACTFCPFHSDLEWDNLKTNDPEAFAEVVKLEQDMQRACREHDEVIDGIPFLHSSVIPIDEVDFNARKPGYQQVDMFGNECEGMCGV